ncbi:hypothetical protein PACTADRAFT_185469 [Pachysolen tannophilus NRRL Y-2460]|uniref:DNA/RNA-binding protein Alba-like domain-containing protein n=1 Tax=Pachysolen tannophilus NRRL Y-2460 TaxID=669874 RepID=A0A1E4U285_PACTA|nr:hypothetical protein PACTADRAFT_185469 [Pachysolen tannophilus NRRL Y-2460]
MSKVVASAEMVDSEEVNEGPPLKKFKIEKIDNNDNQGGESLTQTWINNYIDSLIISDFETKSQQEGNKVFKPLGNLSRENIAIIRKNDNIKRRINQLLRLLLVEDKNELLIISQSSNIQKMLSILEILKKKIKNNKCEKFENDEDNLIVIGNKPINGEFKYNSFHQYNRLESITSVHNPNYKQKNKPQPTKQEKPDAREPDAKHETMNMNKDKSTETFTKAQLSELKNGKLYKIPILYVYLNVFNTKSNTEKNDDLLLNGWTFQH